mmetsp:Transcript_106577/g.343876  ORF Transcript_106577/g.343876 Transcript_106577/m.343876 type:complete len:227 (-) Transcript_106577:148-828(-)
MDRGVRRPRQRHGLGLPSAELPIPQRGVERDVPAGALHHVDARRQGAPSARAEDGREAAGGGAQGREPHVLLREHGGRPRQLPAPAVGLLADPAVQLPCGDARPRGRRGARGPPAGGDGALGHPGRRAGLEPGAAAPGVACAGVRAACCGRGRQVGRGGGAAARTEFGARHTRARIRKPAQADPPEQRTGGRTTAAVMVQHPDGRDRRAHGFSACGHDQKQPSLAR